jgi:hypothetical protein
MPTSRVNGSSSPAHPRGRAERSVNWHDERSADAYLAAGATLHVTEIRPTAEGSTLEKMLK